MAVLPKMDCRFTSAKVGVDVDGNGDSIMEVPMGWRFMPTDEELIISYLSRKVAFRSLPAQIIKEIDATEFYKHHPNNLVDNVCFKRDLCSLETECYLFINHDQYFHGRIIKMRQVGEGNIGFWRCDGKEEAIFDAHGNVFAYKLHSTFYNSKSKKTSWKMEEYRLVHRYFNKDENSPRDEWVVARIRGAQSLQQKLEFF
ncbi:NAC domain-containing protein JA2-like [Salvia miltiorrhiza]|uniref:NAC domain-containing protein JA2-like n=1 Tax=Salvia miltiorrhiza TaxID=226208 RepID=UPI0025AB72B0|nr:NAC domain-containing protein JA2-like [Salvia miltiorrhiza]